MYHAYRSRLVVVLSGWWKSTIALLEPGEVTSTVHTVPSGERKVGRDDTGIRDQGIGISLLGEI
jgi:hypothetical protein